MEIKSYNITLTEKELLAIYKTLGGFTDIEFDRIGINGEGRELLRDIYNELVFIYNRTN